MYYVSYYLKGIFQGSQEGFSWYEAVALAASCPEGMEYTITRTPSL